MIRWSCHWMVKDLVCDCGLDPTIGAESRVQFPCVTSYICDLYDYISQSKHIALTKHSDYVNLVRLLKKLFYFIFWLLLLSRSHFQILVCNLATWSPHQTWSNMTCLDGLSNHSHVGHVQLQNTIICAWSWKVRFCHSLKCPYY